jgi:hypothetical protein
MRPGRNTIAFVFLVLVLRLSVKKGAEGVKCPLKEGGVMGHNEAIIRLETRQEEAHVNDVHQPNDLNEPHPGSRIHHEVVNGGRQGATLVDVTLGREEAPKLAACLTSENHTLPELDDQPQNFVSHLRVPQHLHHELAIHCIVGLLQIN